jgi:hypothetical protein
MYVLVYMYVHVYITYVCMCVHILQYMYVHMPRGINYMYVLVKAVPPKIHEIARNCSE